jgi:hypothetical protein
MLLALLEDIRALDTSLAKDQKDNNKLNLLIQGVSSQVETYLNRKVQVNEYTEILQTREDYRLFAQLSAYPITSISEIKDAEEKILQAGTDLEVNYNNGFIRDTNEILVPALNGLTITYTGGMATDTSDFKQKYGDLYLEICFQVIFKFKRMAYIAIEESSVTTSQTEKYLPDTLRPELVRVLNLYRRNTKLG